jgi:lipopolysaccharide export system protein LptA
MAIQPFVCAVLCWVCMGLVHAEKADKLQPLNAEADALKYDDARQTSVFTGNVVVTKGTILIKAARVEVRQDAKGHQFGVMTGDAAKPALFRQKRDGLDESIEGTAQRIEYDSQQDQVQFIGSAVLRRYRGAVVADETSGATIVYDNARDAFTVNGAAAKQAGGKPDRVRAMLTPNPGAAKDGGVQGHSNLRPSVAIEPADAASP